MSGKTVSGIVGDTKGNKYISYLHNNIPKVMKVYIKKSLENQAKIELLDLKELIDN